MPILLGAIAVRLILYPEKPEANGRIVIGLSALVIGVLGQVHIACGSPGREDGTEAMQDAGGLIGWAASKPLIFTMGEVLAVPLLLLLTVFGLLVVTATPVNAIPQRLRLLGVRLGIVDPVYDPEAEDGSDDERYDEQWREALPARSRRTSRRAEALEGSDEVYDTDRVEAEALAKRRGRPRRPSVQPAMNRSMDAVDVAAAAAAALDGAVLNGMPPSPVVADLTQGVSVDRERAGDPGAGGQGGGARAEAGREEARREGVLALRRRPRPDQAGARALGAAGARRPAPSSSSCPATSRTRCPRSICWSAAAPARPAAPPTTRSSPR